jgi:hypothetical protein
MIVVIILWWPVIAMGWWAPPHYRYPLIAFSVVTLGTIFVLRVRRVNAGLAESENMMQARFHAERMARGGDPDLAERTPPDVLDQLPFVPPAPSDKPEKKEP